MKIEFVKSKGRYLVGAILLVTLVVSLVAGIHEKKHPSDMTFEFFEENYLWRNYGAFAFFAQENNFDNWHLSEIEGTLNGTIDSLSLDKLNVISFETRFAVGADSVYTLHNDIVKDTVYATVEIDRSKVSSNLSGHIYGEYFPLYDAVRSVKWSKKVETPHSNKFLIKSDNGLIYYYIGDVKVNTISKKPTYSEGGNSGK